MWVVLFNKPNSSLTFFSSFSMKPVLLVVFTMLSLLIFGKPRALISSFATRLLFSSLRSLEIRFPGPCLVAANLFHLSWWACRGVNNPTCEAVNLKPASAYLLLPPTLYRRVRNFHTLHSLSPSPSFTASSASLRSPRVSVWHP